MIMRATQPMDMLKVMAAKHANPRGTNTRTDEAQKIGTVIMPRGDAIRRDRKRWIVGLRPEGIIYVNKGAARALDRKKSLFSAGLVGVRGHFSEMSCVSIRLFRDDLDAVTNGDEPVIRSTRAPGSSAFVKAQSGGDGCVGKISNPDSRTSSPASEVEIALALVNYTSEELQQIQGCQSDAIASKLGSQEARTSEVAHRANIVLCRTGDF